MAEKFENKRVTLWVAYFSWSGPLRVEGLPATERKSTYYFDEYPPGPTGLSRTLRKDNYRVHLTRETALSGMKTILIKKLERHRASIEIIEDQLAQIERA